MKFLVTSKKKATATKSNGDGPQQWPLPSPPPDRPSCNKREGYSLPVDSTTQRPPRTISRLEQKCPQSELCITSTQTIAAGKTDGVPVSPKMVRGLGVDGKEEEKIKNAMWRWPWQPSDSNLSDHSVLAQRDSTSTHIRTPQPSFTNRRGCNSSRPVMLHSENSSVANGSANRIIGQAANRRGAASANRSIPNGFRAQECSSTADWRAYRHNDDDNVFGSSPSYQFSPGTPELADSSSAGKASPGHEVSRCSTPQRSPRKHLVTSSQGMKSLGPQLHESYHKPCKLPSPSELPLPSPTRPPHQLDRRTQTYSSTTAQHDLASRPRSLPSLNFNREASPLRYKAAPSTSSHQQHDQKLTVPVPPSPRNLTPPSSPRPLKMNQAVMHLESNQDYYIPSPRNSPQRSVHSPTYQDSPGNASPLHRFLQPVPKPPQRWKRGAKIGSGTFGCVYEGWNLDDGTFFAVKVSNGDHLSPEIHQEVAVLSKLKHPNIVQYYGTKTENGNICIFLELVKMGSLQSIMKNFQVFDEVLMGSYTRQILAGLEYLHDMNTVHRDIKCANILVDSDGQVKLADFGLAKQMKESLATSIKGSPYYMAPEVLLPGRNKRPYGLAVDIWSLGCTVLEMADGKPPWSGLQGYAFFFKVTNGELPPIPEHLSDTAKDFITRCLQKRPEDRPTVKDLLKHPFVAEAPRTFRACFPVGDHSTLAGLAVSRNSPEHSSVSCARKGK